MFVFFTIGDMLTIKHIKIQNSEFQMYGWLNLVEVHNVKIQSVGSKHWQGGRHFCAIQYPM